MPPTVQAVLAARIDKLPATEKRLLQEAAVIGHDFSFTLLQAISGLAEDDLRALLDDLQAAEFLYTTQLFPDLQYTFTHALTHDVAYNELLQQRRRDTHASVVEAMEKLYADRLGEHAERLAHHAVRGELKDKAVHYLHMAGGKAAARSALADARSCFEEALGILKELPESQATLERGFEVRLDLRPVLRLLGEGRRQLEYLREAEIIATQLKDDRRRGQVCAFMTTVQSTLDELDEALDSGSRALDIAERLHDVPLRIVATSYLEQAHCYRGDYERVVALATNNLGALPADAINTHFGMAVPASIFDRAWLVMSLAELGRFAEAAKYEAEAIRIAEPTQHAFSIGWAHFAASMPHLLQGDWAKAHGAGRALAGDAAQRQRRRPSALGGCLLGLGDGGNRRRARHAEPHPGGRGSARAAGGAGHRRPSQLGLSRRRPRFAAARPARQSARPCATRHRNVDAPAWVRRACPSSARRYRGRCRSVRP